MQSLLILHAVFDRAYVLLLRGAADSSVGSLGADFARAAVSGLPVLVDLAALHQGSQEFLALLIDAHRHGAELIGPLSPSLSQPLAMTGLTDWFTVHPTLTAALERLPPPAAPETRKVVMLRRAGRRYAWETPGEVPGQVLDELHHKAPDKAPARKAGAAGPGCSTAWPSPSASRRRPGAHSPTAPQSRTPGRPKARPRPTTYPSGPRRRSRQQGVV